VRSHRLGDGSSGLAVDIEKTRKRVGQLLRATECEQ
jgi:hypothetical protein